MAGGGIPGRSRVKLPGVGAVGPGFFRFGLFRGLGRGRQLEKIPGQGRGQVQTLAVAREAEAAPGRGLGLDGDHDGVRGPAPPQLFRQFRGRGQDELPVRERFQPLLPHPGVGLGGDGGVEQGRGGLPRVAAQLRPASGPGSGPRSTSKAGGDISPAS